jgi:hypothetical protein
MNERIEKWAEAMFNREIERVRNDLEISEICSEPTTLTNEHTEHFAQKAKDLEFYLGWLNELREYANV